MGAEEIERTEKHMVPTIFIALAMWTTLVVTPTPSPVQVLGEAKFSLTDRYTNTFVSNVFADNILLTLGYMRGIVKSKTVDWNEIEKPFTYSFTLQPGDVFAFHEDTLPEFTNNVVKTTNAHFDSDEGFKSDGYLVADGVCHLASLMNEAATRAGLEVDAPTNHDFAVIPEVARQYGTAIYFMPGEKETNARQNLYIKNTKEKPVTITFSYKDEELDIALTQNQ